MIKKKSYELFYEMEQNFNLFSLTTDDKLPIWDIIRFFIWRKIFDSTDLGKRAKKEYISKIFNFLTSVFSIRFLLTKKADNLFYSCSRTVNKNHEYYDSYYDHIKDMVDGKWILYETMIGKEKYSPAVRIFDVNSYFLPVLNLYWFFKKKSNTYNAVKILEAVQKTFPSVTLTIKEVQLFIIFFRFEYFIFKHLLKFLNVKKVFYYGLCKSLCLSAKDLNIPCYEFQHGEITDASILYIYKSKPDNFIYPKKLFIFSKEWTRSKAIPYECVEIGSINKYDIDSHEILDPKSIVILSSPFQGDILIDLAIKMVQKDTALTIHFKLHPMEFQKYDYYKNLTCKFDNIHIIDISLNILDVLKLSNHFVLIYSTTLFEIIQSGKNAYLYSHSSFHQNSLPLHSLAVSCSESVEDLLYQIEVKKTISNNSNSLTYFKPFDKDAFISALD
jgi:hypothetical protein